MGVICFPTRDDVFTRLADSWRMLLPAMGTEEKLPNATNTSVSSEEQAG